MGFIDKGVSMLKAGDALAIHISRAKDNGVSVRIEPRVTLPDAELEALFDLGYHTKHVDTIFARVFG